MHQIIFCVKLTKFSTLLIEHRWARVLGQGGCVHTGCVRKKFCGRLWRRAQRCEFQKKFRILVNKILKIFFFVPGPTPRGAHPHTPTPCPSMNVFIARMLDYIAQCENSRIFLPLRFYVKSISWIPEVPKTVMFDVFQFLYLILMIFCIF